MAMKVWGVSVAIAAVALMSVGAAGTATAEPAPAPPPVPAPPAPLPPPPPAGPTIPGLGAQLGPAGVSVLQQTGVPAVDPLGTPALPELDPQHALGQNPVPSAPGGPAGVGPNLNSFNNGYWVPQNQVPSAPGDGAVVGVPAGEESANIGRIDWMRQLAELRRNGNFADSFLGQRPKEQLGLPLPGTAPLPGTNLAPGVVPPVPPPQ